MPGVHDIVQQASERNPILRSVPRLRSLLRSAEEVSHRPPRLQNAVAGVCDLQAENERVPVPLATRSYSGRFVVRVPVEVHRRLAIQAAESGVSLNRLASAKLSR